ncbi:MAG: hypothetical protein MJ081_08095 [Ruminococcus sp.]|nr:hypothetical protein [Ruminococcus sp.]
MKLGNYEVPLYYSNIAVRKMEELCGGELKDLGKLFGEGKKTSEQMSSIAQIITILANAEILKHNQEVALGVTTGEKKEELSSDVVEVLMDVGSMDEYTEEIFSVMRKGSKFITPDNVRLAETDIDLAEIEKEKNLTGTTEDTGCA